MARRTTKKKGPTPGGGSKRIFTALDMIEQEKGISKAYMMEKITQALVSAYKRDHEGAEENIVVLTDPEKNSVRIIVRRDVVEEVTSGYGDLAGGPALPARSAAGGRGEQRAETQELRASPPRPHAR